MTEPPEHLRTVVPGRSEGEASGAGTDDVADRPPTVAGSAGEHSPVGVR